MSGPRAWLVRLWRRAIVAPVLVSLANRDQRRGHVVRAKARMLRSVELAPFSFQARFGLACLYLRERDFRRAREELSLARQLSPRRYRAHQVRLPELVGSAELAVVVGQEPGARSQSGICADLGADSTSDAPPFPGDFVDRDEWERFRRLGPLPRGEATALDWDGVIAALEVDEPPTGGPC